MQYLRVRRATATERITKILSCGHVGHGVIDMSCMKCPICQMITKKSNSELKNMKQSRWYKIEAGMAHIFDSGYENKSQSVSVVPLSDLHYYRQNFKLQKLWGIYEEE
ncbi:MAG: hypothetical protein Tp178MES00d2C33159851_41 [Prokaryotic dsDNA virus sp.]|nr:MAG: hypothetical protein Tp178MES00d2C33159851_41 [Prokaryotic dsDNA virus sp.]